RDAWFRAREEYNNRKIDAQYSEDPAVRERWNTVDEPLLRQLVEDAERDWRAKGYKEEVERARGVEETLGAKNPARIWEEWKTRLNPDLDQLTDPSTNQTFLPSAFSPSNILDASSWSKFTLDGQAVRALAEDAPASLRGRLGDQADVDIESLSFEFASLRVE